MKKYYFLIMVALILSLFLTGCSLLSNISQVPATEQSGITYLTKTIDSFLDLIGLWHFDGDAFDSSGYGNDGTVIGGESYIGSLMGQAFSFNGSTCVYVADSSSLDITRATLEAWVKPSVSSQSYARIVFKGTNSPLFEPLYFLAYDSSGKYMRMVVFISGVAKSAISTTTLTNTLKWYHIAGTYDGDEVKIYIDGTLEGTTSVLGDGDIDIGTPALGIGRNPEGSYGYKGLIDEVRIWSSALADTQLDDMTSPVIDITTPLNGDIYLLNQIVPAGWSADDDDGTGVASESGTVPNGSPINTAAAGPHTFTVTAADYAKNTNTKTVTYNVLYNFSGILQPINADGSSVFKQGSTVPVKFQLRDDSEAFITNAVAKILVTKIANGDTGTEIEAVSTSAATTGNLFRYDLTSNQYIFNLNTKPLSLGTWQIRIELDDGTSQYVKIGLR